MVRQTGHGFWVLFGEFTGGIVLQTDEAIRVLRQNLVQVALTKPAFVEALVALDGETIRRECGAFLAETDAAGGVVDYERFRGG